MDSKLILASNIKLDKSYTNVLSYSTNQMLSLVESNKEYEQWNYNNIDYDKGVIQVSTDYSVAIGCNYLAFQNPRHGNKWYFAFIDDVIYKSQNCCDVKFTIDVWSTFYDNWTAKPCFIVREHVNNDTIGLHTVPESVTTGDYIVQGSYRIANFLDNMKIVVSSNIDPDGQKVYIQTYNGIPSGFAYFVYRLGNSTDMEHLVAHINNIYIHNGEINQMFLAPGWVAPGGSYATESNTPKFLYDTVNNITGLGEISNQYVPKNNKLLTFPYCSYLATNLQGQECIIKPELWQSKTETHDGTTYTGKIFKIGGCLTAGCSIRLWVCNYLEGDDNGVNCGKFPQLNWSTDSYINWLTQQGINQVTDIATNIGSNALSGRENSTSVSGKISNFLISNYQAHINSPQSHGNLNAGDVMFSSGLTQCFIIQKTIKREFAKQIDDYFTRFGYKINETKTPNITGRAYWNFIEIGQDESIGFGSVPSKYMEIINNACRQGVTIWHNHENIGNFNLTNSIL